MMMMMLMRLPEITVPPFGAEAERFRARLLRDLRIGQ